MTNPWYERVPADAPLTQGDLIEDCPLIGWKSEPVVLQRRGDEAAVLMGSVQAVRADAVVMTQACDLEHGKVVNVILCPCYVLTEYRTAWESTMRAAGQTPTAKGWRRHCDNVRDGYVWNLSILNADDRGDVVIEHRIVDFHDVFTAPRVFLESLVEQRGQSRIRLLPPYREHLSQAFARFFMRVGLPVPVSDAW